MDDEPDILRITSRILGWLGLQVTTAENGQQAVEIALLAKQAGYGFDAIVTDIAMPIMDGIEATAKLREKGFTEPIIAISGHTDDDIEQRCLDAGCNEFVAKPVTFDRVYEALKRNLETITMTC